MNVALYIRVSTPDQDPEMQAVELRSFCQRQGWFPLEYVERASGKRGANRPELDRLIRDASYKRFRAVIVWRLDRLGRSMLDIIDTIRALDAFGIRFLVPAQTIDTDSGSPFGRFLIHVLGAFAELERDLIVDRSRAGVAEAKRQGKHCGRPFRDLDYAEAYRLRESGMSWRVLAKHLNAPCATVRRVVAKHRATLALSAAA